MSKKISGAVLSNEDIQPALGGGDLPTLVICQTRKDIPHYTPLRLYRARSLAEAVAEHRKRHQHTPWIAYQWRDHYYLPA